MGTTDCKLDIRGLITSYGLLKVTQAFDMLATGQIMEIRAGDVTVGNDILKVLKQFPYTVLKTDKSKNFFCLRLKKEYPAPVCHNTIKS